MYDLDIGHQPPNLTLINGALAKIELDHVGTISQQLL
jgi:muramoyltetrapeptide carboxypeptidase LdcA involved in peptidoglycan recycling